MHWEIILNALKWIHKVKKENTVSLWFMAVSNQSWIDGCECAEMIFWCQQILIFLCAFLCNSDRCSFKINGERIGQLLLWECHGLNQAGFVEVNRQWPGSIIHWCHHTDVNSKSQEPATGKAEQPWSRKGAGRVWGEQGWGLLEEQAGTQTQLALATALGCLRNRGHGPPAEQQRLRNPCP